MNKEEFLARFAEVFEHSPWIAEQVWDSGLHAKHDSVTGLHKEFAQVIAQADDEEKRQLLRAHPPLAAGVASADTLTASSQTEQRAAGLDRCTEQEFEEFSRLNQEYQSRFKFPFIMAVSGYDRAAILANFRSRLMNAENQEFQTATDQVVRIGLLRIQRIFDEYD
jgi:OHCU decarboxylase